MSDLMLRVLERANRIHLREGLPESVLSLAAKEGHVSLTASILAACAVKYRGEGREVEAEWLAGLAPELVASIRE